MSCATLPYPSPAGAGSCTGSQDRMRPVSSAAGLVQLVFAASRAFRQAYREAARRRRTRQALAELSPRMLRDIGVTPAEARKEASMPWWAI